MAYELFFEGSLNADAVYRTQQQALVALRGEYDRHGRDYVARWMVAEYKRGRYRSVAEGLELADLVASLPRATEHAREKRPRPAGVSPPRMVRRAG